jgi:hypothetical protein
MTLNTPTEDLSSKALFYLKREANVSLLFWLAFLLFELAVGMM